MELDTPEELARDIDTAIRRLAKHAHIVIESLTMLVSEAKAGEIHKVLGFKSWTAYLADALDGQWHIERDKRGEAVRFLAAQGMSQRAIAKMTGASKTTVHRELADVVQMDHLITGLDGKNYPRSEPQTDQEWLAELGTGDRTFPIPTTPEDARERYRQHGVNSQRIDAILNALVTPIDFEMANDLTKAVAAQVCDLDALTRVPFMPQPETHSRHVEFMNQKLVELLAS